MSGTLIQNILKKMEITEYIKKLRRIHILLFNCDDCDKSIFKNRKDYFMVHNELWLSVAKQEELLCMSCFERRLGRKLIKNDFTKCRLNIEQGYYSPQEPELPQESESKLSSPSSE